MDAEQQAVLDKILGQSPSNEADTAAATTPQATPEVAPEVTPEAVQSVPEGGTSVPAPEQADKSEPAHPSTKRSRHDELMEKLMSQARDVREKQAPKEDTSQEDIALARKIREAAQYGPDAVLKAAGVQKPEIDFSKIFGDDEQADPKDQTVKELEERVAKLDSYIKEQEKARNEEKQTLQQQQQQQWAEQEVQRIGQFIDTGKEKFEYLHAAKEMGTEKDLYNGMISMYNQGYQPSYEDMADLVEARIEKLLDLVGPTKKFADYVSERYGVQISQKPAESQTLTGGMAADTPASADFADLPDEVQQKKALEAAVAAKEAKLKELGLKK